jgi:hypothetical protein
VVARRKPIAVADHDQLIAVITVDAYGEDEPHTAFLEVFNQEVRLLAAATVLGVPVDVVGLITATTAWASWLGVGVMGHWTSRW